MLDIELSKQQTQAYDFIKLWISSHTLRKTLPYLTLGGFAGTGKSTLLGILHKELNRKYIIGVMAPTGKAVEVLKRKGIYDAQTIHQTVMGMLVEELDEERQKVVFYPKKTLKVNYEFFIVDEASMVSEFHHDAIMAMNVPTIFVGDHGQLPPVSNARKPFNIMKDPDIRLEEVHRQAAGNPILKLATDVRMGREPDYNSYGSEVKQISQDDCKSSILSFDQIICYTNNKRAHFNMEYRIQKYSTTSKVPVAGDRVIAMTGNHLYHIRNGEQFFVKRVVEEMADGHIILDLQYADGKDWKVIENVLTKVQFFYATGKDPDERYMKENEMLIDRDDQLVMKLDYAYAITCHKSQGSEYSNVLMVYEEFLLDGMVKPEEKRRWLYTCVTRCQHRLSIVRV